MCMTFGAVDVVYALLEPSPPYVCQVLCYRFNDQVKLLGMSDVDTSVQVEIPEELIEVILSKCPVKSVVRFKSVSRSWHSIISGPRFSRILRSKSLENQNKFLVFTRIYGYDLEEFDLVLLRLITSENGVKFQTESMSIYPELCDCIPFIPLCSCDGLMLLQKSQWIEEFEVREHIFWNPFVKRHITIPQPEIPRRADLNHHRYHLYHDSITDDYKIVCLSVDCYMVYSCKNRSWGAIEGFRPDLLHLMRELKNYEPAADGCFYHMKEDEIVYFDCRDGKLHWFRHPDEVKTLLRVNLGAVSGRLCLYGFSGDGYEMLQLWVFEKNGRFKHSWKKLISMEKIEPDMWNPRPVCLTSEDDVILLAQACRGSFKLFMYSRIDYRFQVYDNFSTYFSYFPYRENLYMPS